MDTVEQLEDGVRWPAVVKNSGYMKTGGPGGVVGIATGYGLDGPGIEFRWGRDFPHLSKTVMGPT